MPPLGFALEQIVDDTDRCEDIEKEIFNGTSNVRGNHCAISDGEGLGEPEIEPIVEHKHTPVDGFERVRDLYRSVLCLLIQGVQFVIEKLIVFEGVRRRVVGCLWNRLRRVLRGLCGADEREGEYHRKHCKMNPQESKTVGHHPLLALGGFRCQRLDFFFQQFNQVLRRLLP